MRLKPERSITEGFIANRCSRCAKLFKKKKNALNRLETLVQGKIVMIHAKLRELG